MQITTSNLRARRLPLCLSVRTMSRPTIRLLLFDAFDTLLHPRLPPHVQYVRVYLLSVDLRQAQRN